MLLVSASGGLLGQTTPALVPLPKSVKVADGTFDLNRNTRIVCSDESLLPLAKILSSEISAVTKFAPPPARPPAKPGDLVLELDASLKGDDYTLVASDRAVVKAGNYNALASASTTLLQLIDAKPGKISMPKVVIEDSPTYAYRSAMIDLARKYHSIGGIEQVIKLCRFYKIRYLHLHLSDDHLFMFPSKKFSNAGKSNTEFARFEPPTKDKIEPYKLEELVALDKFAAENGVLIIPEIDLPGHSGRLIADEKKTFGFEGNGSTVNIASPDTLAAIDILLNEVMDVFKSAEYVHLGGDEVSLHGIDKTDDYKKAVAKDPTITSPHDLFSRFIVHLNEIVTKRGRKSIVWEEAFRTDGPHALPKNVTVMAWNGGNNPNRVAEAGYSLINTTWVPYYIVRGKKMSPEFLFNWDPTKFGREGSTDFVQLGDNKTLQGAQMTSWENPECAEIQHLRERAAIVSERNWNPVGDETYADFQKRWSVVDKKLDLIVHPIEVKVDGTFTKDENNFEDSITITLTPRVSGTTIRYTLDSSAPSAKWETYKTPLIIEKTAFFRAGAFDKAGKQVGYLVGGWYRNSSDPAE
jgi:hexosaminidase